MGVRLGWLVARVATGGVGLVEEGDEREKGGESCTTEGLGRGGSVRRVEGAIGRRAPREEREGKLLTDKDPRTGDGSSGRRAGRRESEKVLGLDRPTQRRLGPDERDGRRMRDELRVARRGEAGLGCGFAMLGPGRRREGGR